MGLQSPDYHRLWRQKNREKWNSYSRGYYLRHKAKVKRKRSTIEYRTRMASYLKAWRSENSEKIKRAYKSWTKSHTEHMRSYRRAYSPRRNELYQQNRERICKRKRELAPKYRSRIRAYFRLRRKTNIQFALADRLRATMNRALRRQFTRKSARTFDLIGCSPTALRAHIESLFLPGMSWSNRTLWHVDHKLPLASFNLADPAQQRKAFHFSNLQPLWAKDNQSKGSR